MMFIIRFLSKVWVFFKPYSFTLEEKCHLFFIVLWQIFKSPRDLGSRMGLFKQQYTY